MSLFDDLPEIVPSQNAAELATTTSNNNENPSKRSIQSIYKDTESNSNAEKQEGEKKDEDGETCGGEPDSKRSLVECATKTHQVDSAHETHTHTDKHAEKSDVIPIRCFVSARKGERDEMQDAHNIIQDFKPVIYKHKPSALHDVNLEHLRISFFSVYDGHAGLRASNFANEKLCQKIAQSFPRGSMEDVERDIKKVILDSFKSVDEEFLRNASQVRPHWRDGSTAAVMILVENTLFIANIGDTHIVLAKKSSAHQLTNEHNPQLYSERQRIQNSGGFVLDGRLNGVLEVSRSFGDYQFKKTGLSSVPDLKKYQLVPNEDRFLIIACDGLWKCFTPAKAVEFIKHSYAESCDKYSKLVVDADSKRWDLACKDICKQAVLKMSGDNVTVVLVVLS